MSKDIVLCFDRFFINPILVLLKSIELTNSTEQFTVHIIFSGDGEKESLKNCLTNTFSPNDFTFCFYELDEKILASCPIRVGDYVNISTYYRILLPSVLPATVEKVLYLDGDMLVVDKLSGLWDIDLDNFSSAVVPDIHYGNKNEFLRLQLNKNTGYFNAGFMLINLKYWREHDVQNETLAFIQNYPERCKKHDQDALNYVLSDKLKYVSNRFNYQRVFYQQGFDFDKSLKGDIASSAYSPCIIHYCDLEKPWHKECFHPLQDVWRDIAKKVLSGNFRLTYKYSGKRKYKFIVKRILGRLGMVKKTNVLYTIDFEKLSMELRKKIKEL